MSSEDVFGRRLRVLDRHVEVPAVVEHARVDELEFGIAFPTAAVLVDQRRAMTLAGESAMKGNGFVAIEGVANERGDE